MLNENEEDEAIKVILVGNPGVGKTSIINRFCLNEFSDDYTSTYTSSFTEIKLLINNKDVILNIWDTAGQEKYRSVNKLFVKGSKIVILVYDITSKKTFEELSYWFDFVTNELGNNFYLGLIGNKLDKMTDEEVSYEEAKKLAENYGAYFSLLSAKEDKEGIDNYFEELVKQYLKSFLYEYVLIDEKHRNSIVITKQSENNNIDKEGTCCKGNNENKKRKEKEKEIRIVFLGAKGVGKSNIINSIRGKRINNVYEHTNNINKIHLIYKYKKNKIKIKIYDTDGDGINNNKIIDILKFCNIFYLVFDLNKRETFIELEKWANETQKYTKDQNIILTVLGNKNTIEEEKNCITKIEGEAFANKLKGRFEIVSIIKKNLIKNMIINDIEKCLNNS
jgi:small GTP-binding protein